MRAVFVGAGAVGARAARQLVSLGSLDELVIVDADGGVANQVANVLGAPARAATEPPTIQAGDVVVVAAPVDERGVAEAALESGAHVVSTSDRLDVARHLLDLDAEARERGCHVVVGAGFSPGLSCVLAARAALAFDRVDEIYVAKLGTGGPTCAHNRHRALRDAGIDWRDGGWVRRRGGSARQLAWFPDPIRGVDCYAGASPEPVLLLSAFPALQRTTVRVAANRRDRLTARLPMVGRPPAVGGVGAVRVDVRGRRGRIVDEQVLGAVDRPAVAAAAVAAVVARWVLDGRLSRPGAGGLAELVDPDPFLAALADRGVKAAIFEGAATPA